MQLLPEGHPDAPWLAAIIERVFAALLQRTAPPDSAQAAAAAASTLRGGADAVTTQLTLARALLQCATSPAGATAAAQVSLCYDGQLGQLCLMHAGLHAAAVHCWGHFLPSGAARKHPPWVQAEAQAVPCIN